MNIEDITGVFRDSCTGHTITNDEIPDHLKHRCASVKFNVGEEFNEYHQDKIREHNKGNICMSACLMNWKERTRLLYKLLMNVSDIMYKLKFNWVLYYGGLLGYHRENRLLPWDCDLDILMNINDLPRLQTIAQNGVIYEDHNTKFYLNNNTFPIMAVISDKLSMLYCDVFYWKEKGNTVLISRDPVNFEKHLRIPREKFFPLHRGSIKGIDIYIPNDVDYNLRTRYGTIENVPYKLHNGKFINNFRS